MTLRPMSARFHSAADPWPCMHKDTLQLITAAAGRINSLKSDYSVTTDIDQAQAAMRPGRELVI
jgi:hypothetical protein